MKNVGSEQGMIGIPDLFWAECGSGISGGAQDGSLISGPCRMKSERNCQSTIGSAKTKRDIDIPHLIDYKPLIINSHFFLFILRRSYYTYD